MKEFTDEELDAGARSCCDIDTLTLEDLNKAREMALESLSRPRSWYSCKMTHDVDKKEARFWLEFADYWERKKMKIKTIDAWSRLEHFKKQDHQIADCCQNLIDQRPFGERSFYIFAHPRTDDDGVTKRLIWQPRLTRPTPQTNSMLFKWIKGTDNIKVCWMIPDRAMWGQYKRGNITESDLVGWSIYQFENHREKLSMNDPEDPSDAEINRVYREICEEARRKRENAYPKSEVMEKSKPNPVEAFSVSLEKRDSLVG